MRGVWFLLLLGLASTALAQTAEWPYTEGQAGGGRFSPLGDITPANVASLEVVWTYRHGDWSDGGFLPDKVNRGSSFESTPIVVDGRLVFTTPTNRVIALDPDTGRELWQYDPQIDDGRFFSNMKISRGVGYWRGPSREGRCAQRVLLATLDARLIALDAETGVPCPDFGRDGQVDLLAGLEGVVDSHEYNVTSPPLVVGDVAVVGSSIADVVRRKAPPGDVRAFDVRSGELRWTFHTIPHEGEYGYETWLDGTASNVGAANVWTSMTADLERGWVFLPVSTASPDFFGGDRPGANLFSDSLVVLEAATGRRIWHFQTVHHDLWDYDLPAPPNLVEVVRDGRRVDAVAVATKHGFVFVLDRESGEPIFPVEERPVPQSDIPEERSHPTQPFPTRPPPLVPQRLTEDDLWDVTPEHLEACRKQLAGLRNDGLFTPPAIDGSVLYPYTAGGANWSGASYDPRTHMLYVPVNNSVHVIKLAKLGQAGFDDTGARPMRGYLRALWWFARGGRGTGLRYFLNPLGGRTVMKHDGVRCNKPPWGWLVAVDVNEGTIRWKAPAGRKGPVVGLPNFGPALATAGGLVFHSGSTDEVLRAHDSTTGEVVARFPLPAGLHMGPISYRSREDGPQLLVIAPGGHIGLGTTLSDWVIAYALPGKAVVQPTAAKLDAPFRTPVPH